MKKRIVLTTFFVSVLLGSAGISYAAFSQREPLRGHISGMHIPGYVESIFKTGSDYKDRTAEYVVNAGYMAKYTAQYNWTRLEAWAHSAPEKVRTSFLNVVQPQPVEKIEISTVVPISGQRVTLSEMKAKQEWDNSVTASAMEPSSGNLVSPSADARWSPDQDTLDVEAVLVPRQVTVISSSQDGKIHDVLVGQGDRFKKGDTLITYDCADLEAEAQIAGMAKDLTKQKSLGGDKLFKLDIISDIDRLGIQIEDKQASSKVKLYQARLDHCTIKAQFNGRVTNRLANPGEYTRTDRVLMEVASDEPLQAEFMVPSKWLRWVNTGAPLRITINETEATYIAKISRIYGEVDPVSQSIQMIALLEPYNDPLLPGMSGQAKLSITEIEKAGVKGYLQASAEH